MATPSVATPLKPDKEKVGVQDIMTKSMANDVGIDWATGERVSTPFDLEDPGRALAGQTINLDMFGTTFVELSQQCGLSTKPLALKHTNKLILEFVDYHNQEVDVVDEIRKWVLTNAPDGQLFFLVVKRRSAKQDCMKGGRSVPRICAGLAPFLAENSIRADFTSDSICAFWRLRPSNALLADPTMEGCLAIDKRLASFYTSPLSSTYFKTWETKTVDGLLPLSIHLCGTAHQHKQSELAEAMNILVEHVATAPYLSIALKTYGGGTGTWTAWTVPKDGHPACLLFRSRAEFPADRLDMKMQPKGTKEDFTKALKVYMPAEEKPVTWARAAAKPNTWFSAELATKKKSKPPKEQPQTEKGAAARAMTAERLRRLYQKNKESKRLEEEAQRLREEEERMAAVKEEQARRSIAVLKQSAPRVQQKKSRQHKSKKAGRDNAEKTDAPALIVANASTPGQERKPQPLTVEHGIAAETEGIIEKETMGAVNERRAAKSKKLGQKKYQWHEIGTALESLDQESRARAQLEMQLQEACVASLTAGYDADSDDSEQATTITQACAGSCADA